MPEYFAKLGTAAVLDADRLVVGSYIKTDKGILIVTKIVDNVHIYTRPITSMEHVGYWWSQFSAFGKLLICGTMVLVVMGILYELRK
jgi:hypothetical protein